MVRPRWVPLAIAYSLRTRNRWFSMNRVTSYKQDHYLSRHKESNPDNVGEVNLFVQYRSWMAIHHQRNASMLNQPLRIRS